MGGSVTILRSGTYETLADRVEAAGYTPEMLDGKPYIDIVRDEFAETGLVGVVRDKSGPLGVSLAGLRHEIHSTGFGQQLTMTVLDKFYADTLNYEGRMEAAKDLEAAVDTVELGFSAEAVFWAYFGVDTDTPIEVLASRSEEAGVAS